ncbi:nitrous oxide reductase family maturation protein NosD [Natronospira bacteriovora]|uniref:Nitrous oxide reductase family maturation protein NosD n=1 Tax=Natronospira bacteriovora TaxID=3069753 RepID=A0ABU0W8M8_9GAMM|nr:nitrous oxide reductase family maturation protein NosD [Natronospira sp. AB-CW4]MDQ2070385.1 nitrous oxide reductase family maturation protein NosD [Natronospira sp. AB-CW4]
MRWIEMKQLFLGLCLSLLSLALWAGEEGLPVAPGELSNLLATAEPGSTLVLEPGVHPGGVRIETSITLKAMEGAVLDGFANGTVLDIAAPNVTVSGVHLRNDGANLTRMDAVIFVAADATGVRLLDNRIEARGFGIWLDGSQDAVVRGNRISGDPALRSQDRGNGIHLFNVRNALVENNEVWLARDGIYIDVSNENRLIGNFLHNQRYGIHYMYSHHNEVRGNRTRENRTGFALMSSTHLEIIDNHADGDEGYGFLLNDVTSSRIEGNTARNIRHSTNPGGGSAIRGGEGKAMFVYNAQFNSIRRNVLAYTDIGIHLTAGSEGNEISENALLSNRTQVMYVATRKQEWSVDGRGNYWSDYMGWDLNGDGIGDTPHQPNDSVDRILWTYPMARVLMNSPAVQLLRWVQREFPVLRPSGVTDSAPLMRPPRSLEEFE